MGKHISPEYSKRAFHCPHCGILADQTWSNDIECKFSHCYPNGAIGDMAYRLLDISTAKCAHCGKVSIWERQKMIYPITGNIEPVNSDLPQDIQDDYNEAMNIVNLSPRGAAALLRLAIQKLCIHLGEKGKNINDDIGNLVKRGLSPTIQKALDSVRVIGNNAVHPGFIDLNDKIEVAQALFGFVNIIADVLITQPKKIQEYYDKNIPEGVKNKIEERDK
jgi:hypothetical protein